MRMKGSLEMKLLRYMVLVFLVAGVTFSAVSCGLSSDDTTATANLDGMVVMGPVDEATVSVYVLNADGTKGDFIASTTTDADGKYMFTQIFSGPIMIVVTGGTYTDEATGDTVVIPAYYELTTLIAESK